jgi:hypothetical protein
MIKRHGTTTLFAALDVLEGRVIGQCMARHRHQEFIHFLNKINRETPAGQERKRQLMGAAIRRVLIGHYGGHWRYA